MRKDTNYLSNPKKVSTFAAKDTIAMQSTLKIRPLDNSVAKHGVVVTYFDTFSSKNACRKESGNSYKPRVYTYYISCSFNGKEKDRESGFHYYGARYYWGEVLTGWLSMDPLIDKYPSISSYAYCAWNPIFFIDPDGQRKWPIDKEYKGASRVIVSGMYRNNSGALHKGVDIAHRPQLGPPNLEGGAIYATHDGEVVISNTSKTAGNWIVIRNGNVQTKYMHMQDVSDFKVGDYVMEGTPIGTVGTTGHSEGPHVHYQIEVFNPENNEWEPTNPVEGDIRQVTYKMDVDLKDVQVIIDHRDDISQRRILQEITIIDTVEK